MLLVSSRVNSKNVAAATAGPHIIKKIAEWEGLINLTKKSTGAVEYAARKGP